MPGVDVSDLRVVLTATGADIIDDVALTIDPGEIVGIVGESGSGKTTVGTALLNGNRRGARVAGGRVRLDGVELLALDEKAWRDVRGRLVAYVPQDPTAALNPALRIRKQLDELFDAHEHDRPRHEREQRIAEALAEVKLPSDDEFLRRFPHQLSGGQKQRVCLAIAFLLRPDLIVLDEPTTGLDVTTQAHVLETVKELCANHSVAALYITHDLAVVGNLCDRLLVMYAGRIVETGTVDAIFTNPSHPYTRELLASVPDVAAPRVLRGIGGQAPRPGDRPSGCAFAPRCPHSVAICGEPPPLVSIAEAHDALCHRIADIASDVDRSWELKPSRSVSGEPVLQASQISAWYGDTQVLSDVTIEVGRGECLAIVGESGSGKTTLTRVIVGQLAKSTGAVKFMGEPLAYNARDRTRKHRQEIQYVFQSPYSSLNPRHPVRSIIEWPLGLLFDIDRTERRRRSSAALEMVSLPATTLDSFPGDLSGGELQRVAIARALACEPTVMVCDEITSALDVSVQAGIVELLERLQSELDLSLIFVTHNLALVRSIADHVAVLHAGNLVETGTTAAVLDSPTADYTKVLLGDTPTVARWLTRDYESSGPAL